MGRLETREELFKLIFEYTLVLEKNEMLEETLEEAKLDKEYILSTYNGIVEHYDELKQEIAKYTKGYSIERVFKIDLALLLVAVYEIKYIKEIPAAVSINEALNLAKKYSTPKSASFINGVLANFAN